MVHKKACVGIQHHANKTDTHVARSHPTHISYPKETQSCNTTISKHVLSQVGPSWPKSVHHVDREKPDNVPPSEQQYTACTESNCSRPGWLLQVCGGPINLAHCRPRSDASKQTK